MATIHRRTWVVNPCKQPGGMAIRPDASAAILIAFSPKCRSGVFRLSCVGTTALLRQSVSGSGPHSSVRIGPIDREDRPRDRSSPPDMRVLTRRNQYTPLD